MLTNCTQHFSLCCHVKKHSQMQLHMIRILGFQLPSICVLSDHNLLGISFLHVSEHAEVIRYHFSFILGSFTVGFRISENLAALLINHFYEFLNALAWLDMLSLSSWGKSFWVLGNLETHLTIRFYAFPRTSM